jgi:hypothetical protein
LHWLDGSGRLQEGTGAINRSDPWRHTAPLMILGRLQNAGHCYSAFSHGLQDICIIRTALMKWDFFDAHF